MHWFRRLGLQRRIMLYVAIGLALMFIIGAYGGFLAIGEATELMYQERLGTALTTAAALEHNLQELAHHVESVQPRLVRADYNWQLEEIGSDLLAQVSATEPFLFVNAQALWLIDQESGTELAFPSSTEATHGFSTARTLTAVREPSLLFVPQADSLKGYFGTLVVPVKDDKGLAHWTVILHLAGMNRDEPYFLPPSRTAEGTPMSAEPSDAYALEVLGPEGKVTLTRGGKTPPGEVSPHLHILQEQTPQTSGPYMFLHRPKKGQKFASHVVAAVPLPSSSFVVLLQQNEDVALALPLRLRQRLILFFGLGFVATMVVAWVTTRHVVKPTERLTVAAQRIAEGKVETPITVAAQDEIGTLAESLEIMRLRLQAWGSELEKQVQERTSELEEKHRELRALYETLQGKEEQLRALLGKVLGAQEDERKRVSRELHDSIGQALSALSMGLERLEDARLEGWPPDLQGYVKALRELATETLSDLRRLTVALRPAALDDLGLVPAIRRYAELYLGAAGVEFDVTEQGLGARLDPSLETVIYRVVQEAINNVARHSGATWASIHLLATGFAFIATVEDNGHGFDPSLGALKQGVGLQGMQERASLAGGKLTIDSGPGRGTKVRLEIPLVERIPHDA